MFPSTRQRLALIAVAFLCGGLHLRARPAAEITSASDASSPGLKGLSLSDLMQLEVSTVSRKTEPWWQAPGAVDVVTSEDIHRSGVMNLPDALRLATGVHVAQPSAQSWAIGIRGFNLLSSNKVNVQLDGRNLYTPFLSGVAWVAQDTAMDDIDRIEVVRGPAGAMWGNYAMNGFIGIVTKPAWETQGTRVSAAIGTELPGAITVRHGGRIGTDTFYRAYLKYTQTDWTYSAAGHRTQPPTDAVQAGFRSDSRVDPQTTFTLEGDVVTNKGTPKARGDEERFSGGNLLGRWRRALAIDSDVQVSGYYDETAHVYGGNFVEKRRTGSASAKYRFVRGAHDVQFGADALVSHDKISSGFGITIEPPSKTFHTASLFAADTIALVPERCSVTLAGQVQSSSFSGIDYQPTVRLAWTPTGRTTLWSALSRAVRTPVRLDAGLVSRVNGTIFFQGNNDLKSEKVVAFELGARHRFSSQLAVDLAAFANDYHDIRSYESATSTFMAFPWTFKNSLRARSTGAEVTLLLQPTARLFIKAGYRYLDLRLSRAPGSGDFLNGLYEANDPRHVATITVRADLGRRWSLDTTLRYASSLPRPVMAGYTTADLRLGWAPNDRWEFALIGRNLLDPQHPEFVTPNSFNEEVARSVTGKTTWRF